MTAPRDDETPTPESDDQIKNLPTEATEADEVRGGKVTMHDIPFVKWVDKSSPVLS